MMLSRQLLKHAPGRRPTLVCDALVHRWRVPVQVGDRCVCGNRTADVVVARVLSEEEP
jgi:hypothetical protein